HSVSCAYLPALPFSCPPTHSPKHECRYDQALRAALQLCRRNTSRQIVPRTTLSTLLSHPFLLSCPLGFEQRRGRHGLRSTQPHGGRVNLKTRDQLRT